MKSLEQFCVPNPLQKITARITPFSFIASCRHAFCFIHKPRDQIMVTLLLTNRLCHYPCA